MKHWILHRRGEKKKKKKDKLLKNLSPISEQSCSNKIDYYDTENCCIPCDDKGNLCKIEECKKIKCIECSWHSRRRFPHCRHTRTIGNVIYPPDEYFRIFGVNKKYLNESLDKYIEKIKNG